MKLNFKERKKQAKGITLIALVITIIVLLILAGVTIATLTGENGILQQTQNAKTKTTEGEEKEQIRLGYSEYQISKHTGGQEKLKVEGAIVTGTEGAWKIKFDKSGNEYDFDGITSIGTTGPWKQEGDTLTNTETKQTLKVGDYVDYDPTLGANASDLTYSSPSSKTGANSNQDFNAATYKNAGYGWRVLGVSNGKVRLISEEFVGAGTYSDSNRTYYTLKGKNGYINGIDELKTISAIFGHGKGAEGATSITVDDINAITGYNPTTAKYGEGQFYEYENKVTYTRGEGTALSSRGTNGANWSGPQSIFNYYDKATKTFVPLTSGSIDITSTSYFYYPGTLNSSEDNPTQGDDGTGTYNEVFQMLFGRYSKDADGCYRNFTGEGVSPRYWLASVYASASSRSVGWGLRYVNGGYVNSLSLCNSDDGENSGSYGVRPVVSLKSDVSLEWNDIAKEWKIK